MYVVITVSLLQHEAARTRMQPKNFQKRNFLIAARTLVRVLALFHGVILSVHIWFAITNVTLYFEIDIQHKTIHTVLLPIYPSVGTLPNRYCVQIVKTSK